MPETTWEIAKKVSSEDIKKFAEYSPVVVQLLFNRELKTQEEIDEFFNPDFEQDLHDPYDLKDMERAVKRILKARKNKEKIAVYGDYDADGVTSSSILTEILRNIGLSGQVYLPDREREGYGLNTNAIDWLIEKNIDLIITTDCGISNKKEIDYAIEKGVDVVVFDHHHVPKEFPKDYIVVNPKQKDDMYPHKDMCAAGIIFKLAEAFYRYEPDALKAKNKEAFLKWLLDLAAIGTVADCMPLIKENRTIVKYGLTVMNKTNRIGLKKLLELAGVNQKLDSYHIGFVIAPRINAAGRIGHANAGYKLLNARTEKHAEQYAYNLEETNRERRKITERVSKEAEAKITEEQKKENIIIVSGEGWPTGVLGIVAGKLTQKYYKPVIVLGEKKDGIYNGSGRGPESFNLIEAITECKELLTSFGGHKQAAGLSVHKKDLQELRERMQKIAKKKLSKKDLVQKHIVDMEIKPEDVNWQVFDEISKMSPFGEGNPEPVFVIRNFTVLSKKHLGREKKHIKLTLGTNKKDKKIQAVGFSMADQVKKIEVGKKVDVVASFMLNEWNGNRELELRLIDIK